MDTQFYDWMILVTINYFGRLWWFSHEKMQILSTLSICVYLFWNECLLFLKPCKAKLLPSIFFFGAVGVSEKKDGLSASTKTTHYLVGYCINVHK